MVAFITFMTKGKLTMSVKDARWSATSAVCLCARACDLHISAMVILISFVCFCVLPVNSSSTNSITSCGFIDTISDAICGPMGRSSTSDVGSTDSFPVNFNFQARQFGSGIDLSTTLDPHHLVLFVCFLGRPNTCSLLSVHMCPSCRFFLPRAVVQIPSPVASDMPDILLIFPCLDSEDSPLVSGILLVLHHPHPLHLHF